MRKRGELDNIPALMAFADNLEAACIKTIESGIVTKDLASLIEDTSVKAVNSIEFIKAIKSNM